MRQLVLLEALVLAFASGAPDLKAPGPPRPTTVRISNGEIRGEALELYHGRMVYQVYKGIPYAQAPQGDLRFRRPGNTRNWKGVMNATEYGKACEQRPTTNTTFAFFRSSEIGESCLFLNVFAPAPLTSNETYPIIVFIHGGDFQNGAASDYDQKHILENFVSKQVVFVTLNYRLGPLGFLSTGNAAAPGNVGLWDIVKALEWVKRDGEAFHGDTNQVTLMGHGSGAGAAGLIALSRANKDLVHRVIMLSGSPFMPGLVRSEAINATYRLQTRSGCMSKNSSDILECLKGRTANEIMISGTTTKTFNGYEDWTPVVDGFDDGLIHEEPLQMVTSGHHTQGFKIPFLVGTTGNESALQLIMNAEKDYSLLDSIDVGYAIHLVRNLTNHTEDLKNIELLNNACYYHYIYALTNPNATYRTESREMDELRLGILNLYGEFWYYAPAEEFARRYSRSGGTVFLYSFDHSIEYMGKVKDEFLYAGAFHGLDLALLFGLSDKVEALDVRNRISFNKDERVTQAFSEMLTNFARYGEPTPMETHYSNWTAFSPEKLNYMSICNEPRMHLGYHYRGVRFWNEYARYLQEQVDIGNFKVVNQLRKELGDYQLATWVLLSSSLFFFAVLIGLACYCMRKDGDEDDL